jgi:hypothetical protein
MACTPGSTSTLDFRFLFDALLLGVVSRASLACDSSIRGLGLGFGLGLGLRVRLSAEA